jgi:hypothetical protein
MEEESEMIIRDRVLSGAWWGEEAEKLGRSAEPKTLRQKLEGVAECVIERGTAYQYA